MNTKITLSKRVQRIKPSPTLAVAAKAMALQAEGKNIISLSVGEPDFDTPASIREAGINAIHAGKTRYTEVEGTLMLRQAISEKFKRENNLNYAPADILVSCGAKQSIHNLMQALLNEGDEVLIPAPYWVSYPDMALLSDATPVIILATKEQRYKISAAQLEASITANTRLLIINSPSNPSGMAYTLEELKALGDVLKKYPSVAIVSDDMYEHILWSSHPFANILNACPELADRTVVVNGVSKSYAMTGWRIGYAAGPSHLIAAMKKVQSQSTSNPCSISQAAAANALSGDQSFIKTMVAAFKERHDYVVKRVNSIKELSCPAGDGTFYAFIDVTGVIARHPHLKNDIDVSDMLLNKAEVAVVPGSAFGIEGTIRISYALHLDTLKEALDRMERVLA